MAGQPTIDVAWDRTERVTKPEPPPLVGTATSVIRPPAIRPRVTTRALLSVTLTCGVATMSYAGAVTQRALFGFVVPAVALAALLAGSLVLRRKLVSATAIGITAMLGWAEIVNVASGLGNGPAARSSFVAGICTVLAVSALSGRFAAFFLVPIGGIVAGAMFLGAGGEVRVVAVATVALAVVALASVEASRRQWVPRTSEQRRPRQSSVAILALLVGGMAAATAVTQAHHDQRVPHASIVGTENSLVKPSWRDPFPAIYQPSPPTIATKVAQPNRSQPHRRATARPPTHHARTVVEITLLVITGFLLLLILGIVTRLIAVRLAWRRTRNRLRRPGTDGVVGAWVWARLRLAACRAPLSPQASPDVAVQDGALDNLPGPIAEPLRQLAGLVVPAAFAANQQIDDGAADQAWQLADQVRSGAEATMTRIRRAMLRFVKPPLPISADLG